MAAAAGAIIGAGLGVAEPLVGSGKNRVVRLDRYPEITDQRLPDLFKDYDASRTSGKDAFDEWLKSWTADIGSANALATQERGGWDRYWNLGGTGLLPEQQDWLTRFGGATRTATDLGNAYALRNQNLDRIGGGGGGNSWAMRALAGDAAGRESQMLLALLSQEQAMRDRNEATKLASGGIRQAIQDALTNRAYMPTDRLRADYGWDTSALASLIPILQASTITGIKHTPSGGQKAIAAIRGGLSGAMGGAMGNFGGGGGGGGGSGASAGQSSINWLGAGTGPGGGGGGWGGGAPNQYGQGLSNIAQSFGSIYGALAGRPTTASAAPYAPDWGFYNSINQPPAASGGGWSFPALGNTWGSIAGI